MTVAISLPACPCLHLLQVRRSPAENINLPAALLSRFDILWLILDRPSMEQVGWWEGQGAATRALVPACVAQMRLLGGQLLLGSSLAHTACLLPTPPNRQDLSLAQHVLTVHREGRAPPPEGAAPLPPEMLRAYIAAAKQYEPYVPDSLTDYVAAVYAEMRAEEAAADVPHSYTTARTLLSILRLSQSLARLRFAESVEQVGAGLLGRGCGRGGQGRLRSRRDVCVCSQGLPCDASSAQPTAASAHQQWAALPHPPPPIPAPRPPHNATNSRTWTRRCGC